MKFRVTWENRVNGLRLVKDISATGKDAAWLYAKWYLKRYRFKSFDIRNVIKKGRIV